MKIVNVIGGLGNQLFQYAFYLALKNKFTETIKLDVTRFDTYELHNGYELEKVFNIQELYSTESEVENTHDGGSSIIKRFQRKFLLNSKLGLFERGQDQFFYNEQLFGKSNINLFYKGYWQSFKYFQAIEDQVKAKLQFPEMTEERNIRLIEYMGDKNTISIHVRRGDYINHPTLGGVCNSEYYAKSIQYIKNNVQKPVFIVFSNDISWCKYNLNLDDSVYIDWNVGSNSYKDMQLMSLCKHNIIANSSFSWWGAWLNNNVSKIVVCPERWINEKDVGTDVMPQQWHRVSVQKP
jgi:hypothetical protein